MSPSRNSLFNKIPLWKPKMSTFNLSFENKLSTDLFRLTPVMCKEVLPDDRVKIRPECFTRMSPAVAPFFHRLNIRFYHFFVPTRIIWDDFEKWINPKTGTSEIVAPRLTVDPEATMEASDMAETPVSIAFAPKSLADYLGVNFGLSAEDQSVYTRFAPGLVSIFPNGFTISSLPFRAYQKIYSDWFIDLNNADAPDFGTSSGVQVLGDDKTANAALYSALLKMRYRAWEHDYFTSALPEPQRGPDVNAFDGGAIDIDVEGEGTVTSPVTGRVNLSSDIRAFYFDDYDAAATPDSYQWKTIENFVSQHYADFGFSDAGSAIESLSTNPGRWHLNKNTSPSIAFDTTSLADDGLKVNVGWALQYSNPILGEKNVAVSFKETTANANTFLENGQTTISLSELFAGISGSANVPAVTVEELRVRMQMQSFLERNEVGGSRYTEMLYAHWGVKDPDGRLQRSEFLGGHTQPLVVSDVQTTVADDENDKPLGMLAGQGTSASAGKWIKYRVPEHGYILTLMCVVPRSAYSQGLEKMWTRFDRLDYYWPSFAHLGEQEVKNSEVMFTGLEEEDGTFGYQSRYAEYKQSLDQCHGDMKGSLAHWHMGRLFETPETAADLPKLSQQFTTPDDSDADALSRVWPVLSGQPGGFEAVNADHFVFDVYMHMQAARRMPFFVTPRNGM